MWTNFSFEDMNVILSHGGGDVEEVKGDKKTNVENFLKEKKNKVVVLLGDSEMDTYKALYGGLFDLCLLDLSGYDLCIFVNMILCDLKT